MRVQATILIMFLFLTSCAGGKDSFWKLDEEKKTELLFQAIEKGSSEEVKRLIAFGVNLKCRTSLDETALNIASRKGFTEIVKMLVYEGAEVNAKDCQGNTPLHSAAGGFVFWLGNSDKSDYEVKKSGSAEIVRLLVNEGAHVNNRNEIGCTPIHNAVVALNKDIIKILISENADINFKDIDGLTPLDIAKHPSYIKSNPEIAELLESYGALTGKELDEEKDE